MPAHALLKVKEMQSRAIPKLTKQQEKMMMEEKLKMDQPQLPPKK